MNISTEQGLGIAVSAGGDPLVTKLWIRTHMPRGAFFQNPALGHRFFMVKHANAAGALLLRDLALEAVTDLVPAWLASVDCDTEIDSASGRINVYFEGVRADGRNIKFSVFYKVV